MRFVTDLIKKSRAISPYYSCYMKRKMSSSTTFDLLKPSIKLNETESKIAQLLKDYVNYENSKLVDSSKLLELRITGGWVRDKLLGDESNDLDIAINTQSGEEFADGLRAFLTANYAKYGVKPSGVHRIEKNPEKSKHLETATTKLYGLDIDFVNLRSEEYTEESRIPVIKFGTPEEDALRRDATLNALFYNIQKDQVEDLTGSGLKDLANKVLRTPLQPLQTFLDDPLRVLRLIRFASRFNFQIALETLDAMKNDKIQDALLHKISRERVGVEIEKTLFSKNPTYGLELIGEANLFKAIFNFGGFQESVYDLNDSELLDDVFDKVQAISIPSIHKALELDYSQSTIGSIINEVFGDKTSKKLFWLSIILRPWSSIRVISNPKKPQSTLPATEVISKEGLKYSKYESDIITKILSTKEEYQLLVSRLPEVNRSDIGLLLKQYGENFKLSLVINLFDEFIRTNDPKVLKTYELFYETVHKENLENSYQLKPIIDGKTLSKKLEKKPGPWMSKINDKILVWQLDNPDLTQDDCIEYVKSIIQEY